MFVYKTYFLEVEADGKFSLGDIWILFKVGYLPNKARKF